MKIKRSELNTLRKVIREQFYESKHVDMYVKDVVQKSAKVIDDHIQLIVDEIMHMWFELDPNNEALERLAHETASNLEDQFDSEHFTMLGKVKEMTIMLQREFTER